MSFLEYILLVLLSLPVYYDDKETFEERRERMQTIASAITEVTSMRTCTGTYKSDDCKPAWSGGRKQLALLLVMNAFHESRLARHIHEGNCRPNECDVVRKVDPATKTVQVKYRARSLLQIQLSGGVSREEWEHMSGLGLDNTFLSFGVASRFMYKHFNACGTIEGAISMYVTGSSCEWKGSKVRYDFYQRLLSKSVDQLKADVERRKKEIEVRLSRISKR